MRRRFWDRRWWIPLAAWCAAACVASVVIWNQERSRFLVERTQASEAAVTYADALQRTLDRALSVTYALGALVRQEGGMIPRFDSVAAELLPFYPGATMLMTAPGGVVRQVYPLRGNEKALGHDLFRDPARREEAQLAKRTEQLVLAGPFKLVQGGMGMVGRLPVFLNRAWGDPLFWGFTGVLLRFPEVLEPANLYRLKAQGYDYALWRIHPDTKQRQVLAEEGRLLLDRKGPVHRSLKIAQSEWVLSLEPRLGWGNPWRVFLRGIAGLVFSLLVGTLVLLLQQSRASARALERMAHFDILTGLPNRALLQDRMERALDSARRKGARVGVCFLDLDGFKGVNDTLGHEAGDDLLREIARRFLGCLREEDTVARMGGDEFVLLLEDLESREECEGVLARVLGVAKTPFLLCGREGRVSASIGVTLFPRDAQDPDTLLRRADRSMYEAKRQGRGRVVFWEDLEASPEQGLLSSSMESEEGARS